MPKMKFLTQGVQKLSSGNENQLFGSCDLDLDPMTLIFELDLDIIKIYLDAKNEVPKSRCSKVIIRKRSVTDRQTDRQTDKSNTICPFF